MARCRCAKIIILSKLDFIHNDTNPIRLSL